MAETTTQSERPNGWQTAFGISILGALGRRDRHVYGGTANSSKVARRRAKNRVARASRKANRR
ncbi:hypothetical protein ACWEOE_31790 [Amycolatopsis sp. NPDC004368]